jgi:hypothetical protein
MPTIRNAHQMLQLLDLTEDAIRTIIGEWAKEVPDGAVGKQGDTNASLPPLPSRALFDARRTLIAATGKLTELVADPSERLLEVSSQYNEARSLHIAVSVRIHELLAKGGEAGVSIHDLSLETGI